MKPRARRTAPTPRSSRGLADFLHELGQLKRVARSGWWLCGLKSVESVAEHAFRAAAIAYLLAELDGADAAGAAVIALFHDLAETRVNDAHRMLRRHAPAWRETEASASRQQLSALPPALRRALERLAADAKTPASREARLAKDADRLECLLQAREYGELGAPTAEWSASSLRELDTPAARTVARAILATRPSAWRELPRTEPGKRRGGRGRPGRRRD